MRGNNMITLVFDTETTGIPKHPAAKKSTQPRIIEWGGILLDASGRILRELQLLINPGVPLEPIITKITGLTDADLADKPTFGDCYPQIKEMFAAADTVVAHNLPFDLTLMEIELHNIGVDDFPFPKSQICTVQEHYEEFGYRTHMKDLYKHYTGQPLAQTHRALDDVMALVEICRRCGIAGNGAVQ